MERRERATIVTRSEVSSAASTSSEFGPITVRTGNGTIVRMLLLSPEIADQTWKVSLGSKPRLLQASADVFADNGA